MLLVIAKLQSKFCLSNLYMPFLFLLGTLETGVLQEHEVFTGEQHKTAIATIKFAILAFLNNTKYSFLVPTKYLWFYMQIYNVLGKLVAEKMSSYLPLSLEPR